MNEDNAALQVMTTTAAKADSERIARKLIDERLAANQGRNHPRIETIPGSRGVLYRTRGRDRLNVDPLVGACCVTAVGATTGVRSFDETRALMRTR